VDAERGIGFEDIVFHIERGDLLDVLEHPHPDRYAGQRILYLGRIDYTVIFPALVAGIVAHLVCGVQPPFPALQEAFADTHQTKTILTMLACGVLFGLIALLLIESLRFFERTLRRFERRPYLLSAAGGVALVLLYVAAGDTYAGLGTDMRGDN